MSDQVDFKIVINKNAFEQDECVTGHFIISPKSNEIRIDHLKLEWTTILTDTDLNITKSLQKSTQEIEKLSGLLISKPLRSEISWPIPIDCPISIIDGDPIQIITKMKINLCLAAPLYTTIKKSFTIKVIAGKRNVKKSKLPGLLQTLEFTQSNIWCQQGLVKAFWECRRRVKSAGDQLESGLIVDATEAICGMRATLSIRRLIHLDGKIRIFDVFEGPETGLIPAGKQTTTSLHVNINESDEFMPSVDGIVEHEALLIFYCVDGLEVEAVMPIQLRHPENHRVEQ